MREFPDDNSHIQACICRVRPSPWTNYEYILWRKSQSLFSSDPCGEIPTPRRTCHIHKVRNGLLCSLWLSGAVFFAVLRRPESDTFACLGNVECLFSSIPLTAACSTIELSRNMQKNVPPKKRPGFFFRVHPRYPNFTSMSMERARDSSSLILPLSNVISEHRCSSCALTFLPFRTIFGTDANVRRQENA